MAITRAKKGEVIDKLTDDETGVDVYFEHVKELEGSIETAKTNADTHLSSRDTGLNFILERLTLPGK